MKIQEVICRALAGKLRWIEGAEILGVHPRSLRRWRARYRPGELLTLFDHRRLRPSHRKVPVGELERILRLYRDRYAGFNVRHFHHLARRDHHVRLCYSRVKVALQEAGLVAKRRARGRHRRRRDERAGPRAAADLRLADRAVYRSRRLGVSHAHGRGAHRSAAADACPPRPRPAGDRTHRRLLAAGPRPRGAPQSHAAGSARQRVAPRSRHHRPSRERLSPGPLHPGLQRHLHAAPTDATSAFVPLGDVDLEQILCEEEERIVGQDNTVTFDGVGPSADRQTTGTPHVRRAARRRAAPLRRRSHSLAWPAVPWPVLRGRSLASLTCRARCHGRFRVIGANIPPRAPRALPSGTGLRRRLGPRLPVGPGS